MQMFSRLYETQLNEIGRLTNIKKLLIDINPITSLLLFLLGIYYMITSKKKSFVFPLASAIILSYYYTKNGKAYYFFPIVLTVLPFGAIFLEKIILETKKMGHLSHYNFNVNRIYINSFWNARLFFQPLSRQNLSL